MPASQFRKCAYKLSKADTLRFEFHIIFFHSKSFTLSSQIQLSIAKNHRKNTHTYKAFDFFCWSEKKAVACQLFNESLSHSLSNSTQENVI